jgi:septal ring factor EnvC (AmiA/AmiB activator)
MADAAVTDGWTLSGKASSSAAKEPEKDEGGTLEDYLAASLKVNHEQRLQLAESHAVAGGLKQENDELRDRLSKAEAKRDWLLAFSKQSLENEASSCDTAVGNAQRLIRSIAKLKLELAAEKCICAQLSADLSAEKLCHQAENGGGQRKSKAFAKAGKAMKTPTAEASTCVDTVSGGRTRWGDLFERDDPSFEQLL